MPRWSQTKKTHLMSYEELIDQTGKSKRSIQRSIKNLSIYTETERVVHESGSLPLTWVDPRPFLSSLGSAPSDEGSATGSATGSAPNARVARQTVEILSETQELTEIDSSLQEVARHTNQTHINSSLISSAKERYELLKPILELTDEGTKERHKAVLRLAQEQAMTPQSIYNWIKDYSRGGLLNLGVKKRGWKKGEKRLSADFIDAAVACFASNPSTTSVSQIRRTLLRAAPQVMKGESGKPVSISTLRRLKLELKRDPVMQFLFMNEDEKKEYRRTWMGQVMSNHANDMWQIDMTRCDILVVDLQRHANGLRSIYRPNIQGIIDVYSGCIPGLSFAFEEDQLQVNLAVLSALFPKPEPIADRYPIWGTPKRLYVDNGKTYVSKQFEGYMARLGIDVVHSRPRVSHTRGKIERFFGTLHQFEKSLTGYAGENAKHRDSEGLKKLIRRTEKWLEKGANLDYEACNPLKKERLLTLEEYQRYVLAWLIDDYHSSLVDGVTRLQHFLDTAPDSTMVFRHNAEMAALMGARHERTVRAGKIRYQSQDYWLPSGELSKYGDGNIVIVIDDPLTLPPDTLLIGREEHEGFTSLGFAELAPVDAASEEAKAARRLMKAQKDLVLARFTERVATQFNPELNMAEAMKKELDNSLDELVTSSKQIKPRPELTDGNQGSKAHKEDSTRPHEERYATPPKRKSVLVDTSQRFKDDKRDLKTFMKDLMDGKR